MKLKKIENSNKRKLEDLNWNKNPEIQEAAERLGIFENPPNPTGKLNLDLLDSDTKKILEDVKSQTLFKEKVKGKRFIFLIKFLIGLKIL